MANSFFLGRLNAEQRKAAQIVPQLGAQQQRVFEESSKKEEEK